MRRASMILMLLILGVWAQARATYICVVCGKPIPPGPVWVYQKTNYICPECHKIDTFCCVCGLPAGEGAIRTQDGRFVCRRDIKNTVLTQEEAVQVFEGARADLERIFSGGMDLKSTNLVIKLFDVDYWDDQLGKPSAEKMRRPGFSLTRLAGKEYVHNVALQSGISKLEMGAICAHEYTHLWINENCPPSHHIEPDTLEAICELVAYKLLVYRGDEARIEKIKKNPYTNGKILTLIDYEKHYGMAAVLEWVRNGTRDSLDEFELASKPVPNSPSGSFVPILSASLTPPRLPTELVLEGLLGSGKKRQALINGKPFEKLEEATIHLADRTVLVQCVEILEKSVIIHVDGAEKPIVLRIDGN